MSALVSNHKSSILELPGQQKWLTHGTSAVRDITEGVNYTARGRKAHEGGKINPLGYIVYRLGSHGLT